MNKKIILIFFSLLIFSICANAHIDVVYPTSNNITVSSPSLFFIGNTTPESDFFINSEPVKLWDNNFFVQVVPLKYGKNEIKMVSKKNGISEEKTYTVTRPSLKGNSVTKSSIQFQPKKTDLTLYTKTIKENATVRENPSTSSKRVIDLPVNTVLYLSGKFGDYYKIEEEGNSQYWIHKSNIEEPVNVSNRIPAKIKHIRKHSDKHYNYVSFTLNYPVLYNIVQNGKNLTLTLFGVKNTDEAGVENNNYIYNYTNPTELLGYDAYYNDNTLVFRIAKMPHIKNIEHPLKNITIFIDPGHGGNEKGSVGPTRTCEKDINLAISRYLMKDLEDEGANVIISRLDDKQVDLYDRVKLAKENKALISLSIHNNALPNSGNPYVKHGTEVHYYNENAKLLAEIIQKNMVKDLNFKDNGIHNSSFALTRATNPVSVLVECAYMINPQEYMMLRNPAIQKQIAQSIKNSLRLYLIDIQK